MRAVFHVQFINLSAREDHGFARLELDLPFAPTADIEIAHPVWKEPRKPTHVIYDVHDQQFFVTFGEEQIRSSEHREAIKQTYAAHGWKV
jgi:hypothetical protein